MDENKLQKLHEVGYIVKRTCGNCKFHMWFNSEPWSTCIVHTYEHQKHTDAERQLSINRSGYCDKHEWSDNADFRLGGYVEFKEV